MRTRYNFVGRAVLFWGFMFLMRFIFQYFDFEHLPARPWVVLYGAVVGAVTLWIFTTKKLNYATKSIFDI